MWNEVLKITNDPVTIGRRMALEQLKAPPIEEVVCGVQFAALEDVDPFLVGTYWRTKQNEFPGRQLHPALRDKLEFRFQGGVGPLRCWLLSPDESLILQIQSDRVYQNWRARGGVYPRFSDHGDSMGLLSRFLQELTQFSEFCWQTIGASPQVSVIQLTKIDHLVRGKHWSSFDDLAVCVPWLHVFSEFSKTDSPALGMRFQEQQDGVALSVSLDTALVARDNGAQNIVKMEATAQKSIGVVTSATLGELVPHFQAANHMLNDVFGRTIPRDQRDLRFSGDT